MSDADSDEEPIIRYGTPLDPIEEDEIPSKRKYQQPADQYAVDAYGRRRFHGAFTGGFSAGHGNTVGTPEGWTPSTFKSSRADKAQISAQRPEDFMDDEDRGEHGIAPRHMGTQSEFSGQKRRLRRFHDGPIPGEPVLEQLLKAVHETAAVKMLRAMGWRPGQGTGDRLTKADKKKAKKQHKVYGCYMPPEMRQENEGTADESEDSTDSEFEYEMLFAPDDYEPYVLQRKNDRFGLGYSGLSRHSVLGNLVGEYGSDAGTSRSHLVMKEKGKKVSIRGQAFGVGAFEADDEDIYATEDMSHYDFTLGGTEDKKKAVKQGGANVLEGFVKAVKPLPAVASYPAPALPRGYAPAPLKTRFDPPGPAVKQRDQGLGRHELSAEARGAMLGEAPVPKLQELPTPSTPQPAQSSEELIAKIAGRNVNFISTTEAPKELDFIPIADTGKSVAKVFRPFMSDPNKQGRYERYLKDKEAFAAERDGDTDAVSEWERNRELVEFEQAAKLYKPLTGIMGDRFTHASEPDDINPLTAVSKSSANYGLATAEQIDAARRALYGAVTRTQAQWRPDPLVCKRFNIPDPGGPRLATAEQAVCKRFNIPDPGGPRRPKSSANYGLATAEQAVCKRFNIPDPGGTESSFNYGLAIAEQAVCKRFNIPDPGGPSSANYGLATAEQIDAARRGLYGAVTRTQALWRPDPLVCKRFNIPDPGGPRPESKTEDKPKISYSVFSYLESSVHDKDSFTKEQTKFSGSKSLLNTPKPLPSQSKTDNIKINNPAPSTSEETINKRITVAELFLKESEKAIETNKPTAVTETIEKFDKMDLYKSIFLSDSENEEDMNETPVEINAEDFIDRPKNVERNLSPPRGIFANIDFDELNSWRRNTKTDKPENVNKESSKEETPKEKAEDSSGDVYGPKIPENLLKRLDGEVVQNAEDNFRPIFRKKTEKEGEIHVIDSSSSADSWVDAKEIKSKRVKKKKKKQKVKHKKSKHKKKDR
ncbi:G patch domain-containing protein 1 homolog [Ostrinia nubilalis]|uniref:G patch domain-containing protein 1 homolog n=1 Tax=Ostrinia nubilalis TaxID=29057 RepID=UPI0030824650